MRRAFGVVLTALALGAVLVAASGDWSGRADAATTCTKHTKRVVKHVKRHGKSHRVVHLKHYWTCQEVAEPVAVAPAAPSSPAPTPETPAPTPEPEPNALGVSAYDQGGFRYELSRQTVRPGQLTLQLENRGEDPHSMDMQKIGEGGAEGKIIEMPVTKAGVSTEPESVYVEPGTYRMWCTIGNHAKDGMEATLTVE